MAEEVEKETAGKILREAAGRGERSCGKISRASLRVSKAFLRIKLWVSN